MDSEARIDALLEIAAMENMFFQDFIALLRQVEARPMKITPEGMLAPQEIVLLERVFRCSVSGSWDKQELKVSYLRRILRIASAAALVRQSGGRLQLSQAGKDYLEASPAGSQYEQMALWYLSRCDWSNIRPSADCSKTNIAAVIQGNQEILWDFFLTNDQEWIEFPKFAMNLCHYLKLSGDGQKRCEVPKFILAEIEAVVVRDLELYGLVEVKRDGRKNGGSLKNVFRFRPTDVGLIIFEHLLAQS